MSKRKPHIMNDIISLSVLLMFTIAIVAGQARAGADQAQAEPVLDQSSSVTTILGLNKVPRLEALPVKIESFLGMPITIEVDAQTGHILATLKVSLASHP